MRPRWLSKWGMVLSLCFLVIGSFGISQGDWQGAGLALGLAAWWLVIDWMQSNDIGILAVIPVSLLVAAVLVYRLPPSLR